MQRAMIQRKNRSHTICGWLLALILPLLTACASAPQSREVTPDPFEPVNRAVFTFNDKLDRYALKPVAKAYRKVTPSPVRTGINNFFGNISDVSVAANSLLQGKFEQGLLDTARVAVNTVIGLGGILDIATSMNLERHNEDFGQTLGVWGVPEGPYLVLPFFGPQTLRSTVGLLGDSQIEPLNSSEISSSTRGKLVTLNVVNARSRLLAASSILDTASLDPYLFMRENYLNWSRQQVNDGRLPAAVKKSTDSELNELDELDELDELSNIEEQQELDELNELDELDNL
jgi:phospholipid-binding lipoprotein MlaA